MREALGQVLVGVGMFLLLGFGVFFFVAATWGQPFVSDTSGWVEGISITSGILVFIVSAVILLGIQQSPEVVNKKHNFLLKLITASMIALFLGFLAWGILRTVLS